MPHSQAQPLLHVAPAPPPHPHMCSLEDIPPAKQSPTLQSRQDVPMSPESPPPTMGSPCRKHSITPPPNITVHDITSPSDITIVATSSCHMMEDKPVHVKRRNGDPDGIALGKLLSPVLIGPSLLAVAIWVLSRCFFHVYLTQASRKSCVTETLFNDPILFFVWQIKKVWC